MSCSSLPNLNKLTTGGYWKISSTTQPAELLEYISAESAIFNLFMQRKTAGTLFILEWVVQTIMQGERKSDFSVNRLRKMVNF